MRTTTTLTQTTWDSGQFVGSSAPMVRATIQRLSVLLCSVGDHVFSSIPFGQKSQPVELPNVRTVKWSRSTENTVATMTMTLFNCEPVPVGQTPEVDLDRPGYYTYQRGAASYSSRWSHAANDWRDWLVPDRVIRTYEGYGYSPMVGPESDAHLYSSGVWLVDDVTYDTEGIITIECRDIGRALLDQILMPPIVPTTYYPLHFEKQIAVNNPPIISSTSSWVRPTYDTSSNIPWGQTTVYGHSGPDAFDTNTKTYWLSVGNAAPEDKYSFEYIQGKVSSRTVAAVRVNTWGGPYQCYVSVWAGGKWQGIKTVPYDPANPASRPNGSNIRYSYSFNAVKEGVTTFAFPKAVAGVTKVRLTFTRLTRSALGTYRYRAGVRTLEVSATGTTSTPGGTHLEPATIPPGCSDYLDIVKILLAWAGWYWPVSADQAFFTTSAGAKITVTPSASDPVLKTGRVWGDFEPTGTAPKTALGVNNWDKKPVMDGITLVRDIVGFLFYIDEDGGAVFRSPNIWAVGNWIGNGASTASRTSNVVVIDESKTILSLGATLSSRSVRERVFVGNLAGQVGAMSKGHNPYPSGLRRVGGWSDAAFQSAAECQIMADLITLRQLFTYRTDKVKIPGNPAIQIDDQVRIYERITEEGYLHYVTGIGMDWSIETGKYTYDLATHWLGETPFSNWTFNPADLAAETQAYLKALGKIG